MWRPTVALTLEAMTSASPFAAASAVSDALSAASARIGEGLVSVSGRRWPITGIVHAKDLVLTAAHAADREEGLRIQSGGTWHPAQLVGRDPGLDLALLRVPGASLSPVTWLEPAQRRVGRLVLAVSRPRGSVRTRLGVLSVVEPGFLTPWGARVDATLDADVSARPGLAGAALADVEGRVLGMYVSGGPRERRVVLPAETLARVASELLAHGRVRRGYLGVGTQPVRLQGQARAAAGQETGLLVLSVEPGGPSDAAGLALGDVLLSLDGTPMEDVRDLLARLAHDAVGRSLSLKLLRGGKLEERAVAVGVRP
jgi:S1-C subfamily serine protease